MLCGHFCKPEIISKMIRYQKPIKKAKIEGWIITVLTIECLFYVESFWRCSGVFCRFNYYNY